jgi:hypothetical protein
MKFTDEQLRADLAHGLKQREIAAKYGASEPAVSKRVNRLKLSTTNQAMVPAEAQRLVRHQIDAVGQLTKSLHRVNLLMDACDDWLRDANDPERYDIGPRAGDLDVTYEVEVRTDAGFRTLKRKKTFAELASDLEGADSDGARFIRVDKGEYKRADPRELILKTAQEARQTVTAAADLAKMLSDAQLMQEWRRVVLDAIERAAPDIRDAIEGEIRSSLVLRGLLEPSPAAWNEVN